MATPTALDTLIDLAQRDVDAAARRLGAALQQVEAAEQKLQMLLGYRDEYAVRLEAAQMNGITPLAYHNFVAFLAKLDNAVAGQREVLKHAQHKSGAEKQAWQASERKRLSYRTLSERAAQQALKLDNQRDQKLMDAHAARSAHYRKT